MVRIITKANKRTRELIELEHHGHYEVTCAHINGTVTIQCGNFLEWINIQRLTKVNQMKEKRNKIKQDGLYPGSKVSYAGVIWP